MAGCRDALWAAETTRLQLLYQTDLRACRGRPSLLSLSLSPPLSLKPSFLFFFFTATMDSPPHAMAPYLTGCAGDAELVTDEEQLALKDLLENGTAEQKLEFLFKL